MEWLYGYIDTMDVIVLTVIVIIAGYVFSNYRVDSNQESSSNTANGSVVTTQKADRSFLGRMKSEGRQVLVLFGSQTGTAEELAGRLAKDLHRYGKKPLVMDPEEIDVEDLPKITGDFYPPPPSTTTRSLNCSLNCSTQCLFRNRECLAGPLCCNIWRG